MGGMEVWGEMYGGIKWEVGDTLWRCELGGMEAWGRMYMEMGDGRYGCGRCGGGERIERV